MSAIGQKAAPAFYWLLAAAFLGSGGLLAGLGVKLAASGGSVFYALSGAVLIACGVQLMRKRASATHLAILNFAVTWAWALWEVGLNGWALLPRVNLACLLTLLIFLRPIQSRLHGDWRNPAAARMRKMYPAASASFVVIVIAAVAFLGWRDAQGVRPVAESGRAAPSRQHADWPYFGQDPGAAKFSSLREIDRTNAGQLRQVWEHVEPRPAGAGERVARKDEATPIQADGKLFVCRPDNVILALDAEDGRLIWRYDPHTNLTGVKSAVCRGVAYWDSSAKGGVCQKRILTATVDARLIALDAEDGKPCADFGEDGAVSLKAGLGAFDPGQYYVTSPPAIAHGVAIVGGLVQDNVARKLPSGVVRAFDVRTGKLVWAWDMGRAAEPRAPLAPDEIFTPGTPNAWSILSVDENLGLVFIPTGNETPDFVGTGRLAASEKYSSSIVALDAKSGAVRWSFQLVRHDLWDYDASTPPALFDMPGANGPIPALAAIGKHGVFFVLDRRTGAAISTVKEQPAPQTDIPGEWSAATQPDSPDMPRLAGAPLRERDMWGISPFDQLWCRLQFRKLRYEGAFTPPSLRGSIQYPGLAGGADWGGVAIDGERNLLFAPSFNMASVIQLLPRDAAEKGAKFSDLQAGTPYLANVNWFITRLGVPCQQPPYGMLNAIDLRTKTLAWSIPLGTAEELGPRGIASHLPFTIGAAPLIGGPIATAGDVVFIGATGDRRLRAIDSLTGRVLWSQKLPQGNQATPITYRAPRSGRQMVVMVSGSYGRLNDTAITPTHVIAYALPEKTR